jgi:serine/threonine protein phosphatase 1
LSVWAIGDIHGQARLLEALLAELPRGPTDLTVFLGDYIDRGPDSREVVERVLEEYDRAPERTILLWGNHEAAAALYFGQPNPIERGSGGAVWPPRTFLPTLRSFGLAPAFGEPDACPASLLRLFGLLRTFWRCPLPGLEHVIFVHAGVPPGQQPEDAAPQELLGIRAEFTHVVDPSGRLVVFGHTWSTAVFQRVDKIGIDTGAGHGGPLSALALPALRLFKVYPDGRVVSHPLLTPDQLRR